MSKPWILLTPSTRGISLALTRHLLTTTTLPIIATTRTLSPSDAKSHILSSLSDGSSSATNPSSRLHTLSLDVTSEASIADAAKQAEELFPRDKFHLHMAFSLPGVLYPEKAPDKVDLEKSLEMFKVNLLGPLGVMKYFTGFLPKSATKMDLSEIEEGGENGEKSGSYKAREEMDRSSSTASYGGGSDSSASSSSQMTIPKHATWTSMSARVGSTSDNAAGGWYSYRASKAGVTSLAKSLDNYLRTRSGDKAISIAYHPGTTKTDLSKGFWESVPKGRLLEPEDAAKKMAGVVTGVGLEGRGRFWDWEGKEILP